MTVPNPYELPSGLPIPTDDGACDCLPGLKAPDVQLVGTDGNVWSLSQLTSGTVVVYVYPATGVPGRDPIPGWDDIPGAPGCTVQSIGFRDLYAHFLAVGVDVVGVSAQDSAEQREFSTRTKIPFLLLSDPTFQLSDQLRLPTFESYGRRFYKRLALLFRGGAIHRVFYPVFPPNESAAAVLAEVRR